MNNLGCTKLQLQIILEEEAVDCSKRANVARRKGDKVEAGEWYEQRDYYWSLSEKLGPVRKQYRVESEYWDDGKYTKADPMYFVDYDTALMYYRAEREAIREFADCGYVNFYTERYVGRKKYDCIN